MLNSCPFDLVLGLDRSDRKADLYFIHTASGKAERQTIGTSPEALLLDKIEVGKSPVKTTMEKS
jgi:hypothetical protein